MTFEFYISSAAIATICSLISGIVSAHISAKTVEKAANKEIEKMKLAWGREDLVSSDDEFAEMSAVVSRYVSSPISGARSSAMEKVAAVRSKENGDLAAILDDLYKYIRSADINRADDALTRAIDERRSMKNH